MRNHEEVVKIWLFENNGFPAMLTISVVSLAGENLSVPGEIKPGEDDSHKFAFLIEIIYSDMRI